MPRPLRQYQLRSIYTETGGSGSTHDARKPPWLTGRTHTKDVTTGAFVNNYPITKGTWSSTTSVIFKEACIHIVCLKYKATNGYGESNNVQQVCVDPLQRKSIEGMHGGIRKRKSSTHMCASKLPVQLGTRVVHDRTGGSLMVWLGKAGSRSVMLNSRRVHYFLARRNR